MRFAVALVALIAAAVMIVAGVAQRTFLKPPATVSVTASVPRGVDYVVIPASVLRSHPGQQRLRLQGARTSFAAYGRTADVTAWLSGQRYGELRVDADGRAAALVVRTAPTVAEVPAGGDPDPSGSDLWLDQRTGGATLNWAVNLPAGMSVIVASDGASPAPSDVRLTWPVPATTPVSGILLAGGGALAVLGLVLYIWALVQVRRSRGPRRKAPPKMPRRPQPPRARPQKPVASGPGRGRRSTGSRAVRGGVPVVAIAVALTLVTGDARPAAAAPHGAPPAVTEQQAQRIVERVAATAARADAARDPKIAAERFAGAALELRKAAYAIRKKDRKYALPPALPGRRNARIKLVVPEATSGWPRSLFVVVANGADLDRAPLALAMVQDDPRADYTVRYAMELPSGAALPTMPSALTGAKRLNPENTVLRMPPAQVAEGYGRLLRKADAPEAKLFDTKRDALLGTVGEAAKRKIAKKLGDTAAITFSDRDVDPGSVIALSTADPGALVAVELDERWTVKPKRGGVTVRPSGGTRILAKTSSTAKGIRSVYGYQLLFQVPSAGSDQPVTLLGYAQGLVSAKEL